ncbi:MAG: response regulator [Acidobacteria bacterium]|nr:response regulator [Acidobacteriota bacterium]MDA1235037.1 response regulator [Acidobacteriota bacterium]
MISHDPKDAIEIVLVDDNLADQEIARRVFGSQANVRKLSNLSDGYHLTRAVMQVLVVDDSRADFEIIARQLGGVQEFRSEVEHCADASGCSKALTSEIVDCVLLDYRLGADSGLEVLGRIRAEGHDHPVIMLTGQGDEQTAVGAMKGGAQDYLVKDGVTSAVLARSISNAVQKVRLERSLREKQNELEGFVSVVEHDLRNPVCSALDSIQVIGEFYAGNPLDSRGLDLIGGAVK